MCGALGHRGASSFGQEDKRLPEAVDLDGAERNSGWVSGKEYIGARGEMR